VRVLILTIVVIIADQVSKLYIKGITIPFLNIKFEGMFPGESIAVMGDFFRITFIENPGMAFGFDPGSDFKLWISLFSLAASIGLLIYLYIVKSKALSLRIAIALILGGAVGNLLDRMYYGLIFDYAPVFYGKVVDFLDFDFFNFTILGRSYDRWPIFNLADASVSIGVLILIFFYRQHKADQDSETDNESEALNSGSGEVSKSKADENNSESEDTVTKSDELGTDEHDKGKEISI
jgi:signal peptidase II